MSDKQHYQEFLKLLMQIFTGIKKFFLLMTYLDQDQH